MSKEKKEVTPLLQAWDELKELFDSCEIDAYKNAVEKKLIPGVRWRHAMRKMKLMLNALVLESTKIDKQTKAQRLATKPKGQTPGKNKKIINK